ncbi:MAG TPA: CbtB domain-containing protein [Methylomirabilota bacterium]|nr:CbtB domain-containing protein [Methylomirabilota bacterium]
MLTEIRPVPVAASRPRTDALTAAAVALVAGLGLLFTMGFAHPDMLHNAAHDWRHSMSFPCH